MKTTFTAILLATTTLAGASFAQGQSDGEMSPDVSTGTGTDTVYTGDNVDATDGNGTDAAQSTTGSDGEATGIATADSAGDPNMPLHEAAMTAITSGNGEVRTNDDVVIGEAQRVLADDAGNIIGLIRLNDEMNTELTAIQVPLMVVTENGETLLRIGASQADLQTALDAQPAPNAQEPEANPEKAG